MQVFLRVRVTDVRDDGGARLAVKASHPPVSGPNAVERAYAHAAARTGRRAPTVTCDIHSDIPMAAGLGSSAAAAVAGLRVFEQVTGPLSDEELLALATELEGHGDNAAAALFGGLTSIVEIAGARPRVCRWTWPDELKLVVATPAVGLATAKARAALPEVLPRVDAVFNLQRVLALVHALERREYSRLREAVLDRWHQPARMALVPQLADALALEDPAVLGAFLSGAGPSVALLAVHDLDRVERVLRAIYERAGIPATVRILGVHSSSTVPGALASAHGRTS